MKNWLKNGFIGALVGFLIYSSLLVIANINFIENNFSFILKFFDFIIPIITYPFLTPFCSEILKQELGCLIYIPISGIVYGFFIGLIISLIRKRKK